MKRVLLGATIVGTVAVLAGCPIYSGAGDYQVCDSSMCYDCPDPEYTNACVAWTCSSSRDCPDGYACEQLDVPSQPGGSHGPVCVAIGALCSGGCSAGYICAVSGDTAQCIPSGVISIDDAGSTSDAAPVADATPDAADTGASTDAAPADAGRADAASTESEAGRGDAASSETDATVTSDAAAEGDAADLDGGAPADGSLADGP